MIPTHILQCEMDFTMQKYIILMIRANFTLFIWLINIKALPLHHVFHSFKFRLTISTRPLLRRTGLFYALYDTL